jgi:tetratricopeptide (TPR) repeat protein
VRQAVLLTTVLGLLGPSLALGQTDRPGPAKDPTIASLPLRSALHRNPTLGAPFDRLVDIYRKAGGVEPLIKLYRDHVGQYPQDVNAQIVFVRLLVATHDLKAETTAANAAKRFPKHPYLHYLHFDVLNRRHAPTAIDALDQAVRHQTIPALKRTWTKTLLKLAQVRGRRGLILDHLKRMDKDAGNQPQVLLDVGRQMLEHRLPEMALKAFTKASAESPSPQLMIELELSASRAEIDLGQKKAAAKRLDQLLNKLTADHWKRGEVLRRRLGLVETDTERQAMIAQATKLVTDRADETSVIDLAQTLTSFDLRRQALNALLAGGKTLPESVSIEQATLDLFDRLRDDRGKRHYLADRIKRYPQRHDLALTHIKSLFRTGDAKDAHAQLSVLIDRIEEAKRSAVLISMGRFLRGSGMNRDAAKILKQVVQREPTRLDLRRELAELLVSTGQQAEAGTLLARSIPNDATLETVLDAVQFMMQRRMYRQARSALVKRLPSAPANMDLRLMLLEIEGKLGNILGGQKLIEAVRKMADTAGRYRGWLTAATHFHDAFDQSTTFLKSEQERLETEDGQWTDARVERHLAFAEVAAEAGLRDTATNMLLNDLSSDPPMKIGIRLRRQLVRMLSGTINPPPILHQQLRELVKEDPNGSDEYNAHLAVLHARANRQDLATPLLKKLNLNVIRDPALLAKLQPLFGQLKDSEKTLAVLRRLTETDSTNRVHWKKWIYALASGGREDPLRSQLRKLLAGVRQLELDPTSRAMLKAHLFDSYWRSVAKLIDDGRPGSLNKALGIIDRVEEAATDQTRWLWVAWARAYVLNRLDRPVARDEALAELERMVDANAKQGRTDAIKTVQFPDGLRLDLEHAKALARTKPKEPELDLPQRVGPLPPLDLKWVFDTGGATVHDIMPIGNSVLLRDAEGMLWMVDRITGRLLWQRDGGSTHSAAHPLIDGDRLYLPKPQGICCVQLSDGRILWEATFGLSATRTKSKSQQANAALRSITPSMRLSGISPYSSGHLHKSGSRSWSSVRAWPTTPQGVIAAATSHVPVSIFLHDKNILGYNPTTGTLSKIDRKTGKLLHETRLPAGIASAGAGVGASLSGDRLFVYGQTAGMIDVSTGKYLWWFDPNQVRSWPINLAEPGSANTLGATSSGPVNAMTPWQGRRRTAWAGSPSWGQGQTQQIIVNYQTAHQAINTHALTQPTLPQLRLLPPLAVWGSQNGRRPGQLGLNRKGRLMIFEPTQSSASLLNADLPLGAKRIQLTGTVIGQAGRHIYLLQHSSLTSVDMITGQFHQLAIPMHDASGKDHLIRAVIDGALVWATSRRRVVCINTHTQDILLNAPLPEIAQPNGDLPQNDNVSYLPHGIVIQNNQGTGRLIPTAGAADQDLFFLATAPHRIVALQRRGADGD